MIVSASPWVDHARVSNTWLSRLLPNINKYDVERQKRTTAGLTMVFVVELECGFASLSIAPTIRVTRVLYPICRGQREIVRGAGCIICLCKGVRYYRTHASIQDTQ